MGNGRNGMRDGRKGLLDWRNGLIDGMNERREEWTDTRGGMERETRRMVEEGIKHSGKSDIYIYIYSGEE